jgi:hypothetical protein
MTPPTYRVIDRRRFISGSAAATASMAAWIGLGTAPAFAQKRELTFLS